MPRHRGQILDSPYPCLLLIFPLLPELSVRLSSLVHELCAMQQALQLDIALPISAAEAHPIRGSSFVLFAAFFPHLPLSWITAFFRSKDWSTGGARSEESRRLILAEAPRPFQCPFLNWCCLFFLFSGSSPCRARRKI